MADVFAMFPFWQMAFSGLGGTLLAFLGSLFVFALSVGLFIFLLNKL